MVATKPRYFLELDIVSTVENFIEYVPEFWSSSEFSQSLRDGEIFSIDMKYFVELFVDWFYDEDSRDVWDVVNDFLMDVSFALLCDRLLITLSESDLSFFLKLFSSFLSSKREWEKFD
ncbi:hypothetical protein MLD38_032893 [Melastoma candidum]|uniref:Uncharacterized protein n=1 Tax=Melastoma candidum TaxID=119954 RepID=A0ACB9M6T4_9MYRT|nr:hypothetical protein MLD38_032893 [Melastoma candidum]